MATRSEDLMDSKGAYLLLISVTRPIELPRRFPQPFLPPGYYGYAGSAYGSGGIRARCRRHLKGAATLRWHIDWITRQADELEAYGFPGDTECRLTETLIRQLQAHNPVNGFGSSDCKRCQAHLVEFDHGQSASDIVATLSRTTSSKAYSTDKPCAKIIRKMKAPSR